ncbi:MAG: HAD family hydrolase, partial [Candidatus Sericytochromatia bacterium]
MRAVFSDLDGSLRHNREGFDARDLATLVRLGEQGVARIVATGRSLYAARKVLAPDFPIDFLIFSSGAGILDWRSQTLLGSWQLQAAEAAAALDCLTRLGLDCMLHQPVPDNHHFHYRRLSNANPDF